MEGISTALENGLRISIDWLSFTITTTNSLEKVVKFLGYTLGDFDAMAHGGKGYKSMIRLNGFPISILYDGNDNMGIFVEVSGLAIPELIRSFKESLKASSPFGECYDLDFDTTVMRELLKAISRHGHISRIDLAIDDIGMNYFSPEDIYSFYHQNKIVKKFRSVERHDKSSKPGCTNGYTLYLGRRTSEIFLRIYDKQAEQNSKKGNSPIEYSWIRWELECKGKKAQCIASEFCKGMSLGFVTVGILANYMRIIESDDTNKSRCTVNEKWLSFLDGILPLKFSYISQEKTLDDKKEWVIRQVMPTLAAIIVSDGGCLDFIDQNLPSGFIRMKKSLLNLLPKDCKDLLIE